MNNSKKIHIAICDPYLETKGGGEKCAIATAEILSKIPNARVSILVFDDPKKVDKKELESYFKADLSKVEILRIKQNKELIARYEKHHKKFDPVTQDFFRSYIDHKSYREHNIDIFINNFYKSNIYNPAPVGIYFCMFPQKLAPPSPHPKNIAGRAYRKGLSQQRKRLQIETEPYKMLDTYQNVISISSFTEKWVKKIWNRESDIVFPICEDMKVAGVKKEKIILNVGRFFAPGDGSHQKKQDVLLDTFLQMEDLHKEGWELHFAGGIARNTEAMEYALKLVMKARDYPVYFHFGRPFKELQVLFNQASIYWHATGYGLDEDIFPDQQEHFGITSVEAMSAGAIPIVLDAAGQRDTVVNGENGYLWTSTDELKELTKMVINLEDKNAAKLRKNGIAYAKKFDKENYQKSMLNIVRKAAKEKGYELETSIKGLQH